MLSSHHPLSYSMSRQVLKSHEPVYQALWADNADFDEVIISPAMIQDHMPDTVLAALNKVSLFSSQLLLLPFVHIKHKIFHLIRFEQKQTHPLSITIIELNCILKACLCVSIP